MGKNINYQIEGLRGISIMIVLLYHLIDRFQQIYFGRNIRAMDFWGSFGVTIFLIISGFFAVDPESASCKKSEVVFALKKFFLRIWPTYMVCVLITYLLTQIRELPGRTYGLKELITNWLGINHLLGMPYIDGAHWYLTVLTAMFLVVLLFRIFGIHSKPVPYLLWIMMAYIIENQKELILRYISCKESLQNVPVMDFVDDGYTGSNFDRPGFQQMMDGVRNGKIDTIIVKDLSRFGRDYIGVGEYMEQIFPLLGVRLIAINDNYDSNNYKGTTLGMDVIVSNLVNTMYCRDAGKKLRTANQVKWRTGITTASAAPFGYQFDPDKKGAFIIDPPAAKIVRRIFDLAILGLGTKEIAMMLNDENVPVPSVYNKENKAYGKETTYTIAPVILWDSSRVWKILTAYVYTGAMVLGKTKTLISGKSIIRTVPKGQRYITEGTHEAIVSREEFEKAQLVIKSNSHKVLMGGVDFPLKGKVRCGNCRRVMAHNFKQVVPTFWCREGLELVGQTQCTSEIFQVSDIESAVFQALKKELSLLDSLYGDMQKEELALKEAHKKANRRKTLMEQELKNLKGEKMRMYEEYAAGTLPLDTYKQKKQECDRRISEVQEQIEQSKAEESAESVVPGTVRAAAEQAENFLHGTRLTAGMVSAFIENVFVHDGGRIVVRFKYEQSIQDTVKALHTD